jgi:predicted nucleic acid-binding protein
VIDTSVLVAALLTQHEHHGIARRHLPADGPVAGIVLAETFAQLRRTFSVSAEDAMAALGHWAKAPKRIAVLPASAYAEVFKRAVELNLGGNIHDALIAKTCAHHKLSLATLDRRQHAVALAFGVESTYLLSV